MEPLCRFEGAPPHDLCWPDSESVRIDVHHGAHVAAGAFASAGVPQMRLTFPKGIELCPSV